MYVEFAYYGLLKKLSWHIAVVYGLFAAALLLFLTVIHFTVFTDRLDSLINLPKVKHSYFAQPSRSK